MTDQSTIATNAIVQSHQNRAPGTAALSAHSNGGTNKGTKTSGQSALPSATSSYAATVTNISTSQAPTHHRPLCCRAYRLRKGLRASPTTTRRVFQWHPTTGTFN